MTAPSQTDGKRKYSIDISRQNIENGRMVDLIAVNPYPDLLYIKFQKTIGEVYGLSLYPHSDVHIVWVGSVGPLMGDNRVWLYNVFEVFDVYKTPHYVKHTQAKGKPDVLESIEEGDLRAIKADPLFQPIR